METGEGYSVINDVNLGYKYWSKRLFGSLEIRLHAYFLEKPVEIYTKEFSVGGYVWQMRIIHKDDGSLACYVYSRSQAASAARFSFTVVSHDETKESKDWGDLHLIKKDDCWGFRKLASIAIIKDPNSGLLFGDIFTIRLDLRLKLPDNEVFTFQRFADTHARVTWRLKNVHDQSPWIYVSDEFQIGDSKWQLQFYPKGQKHNLRHASIFLYSHNDRTIKTKLQVSCENHILASETISRNLEYTFQDNNEGRGWFQFLENKAMEDREFGFLSDGWLTFTADVKTEDHHRVVPQHPVPDAGRANNADGPVCVICLDKVQTSGVLHGETTHKCFCLDCAKMLKERQENINCPICGERVERIIEKFY